MKYDFLVRALSRSGLSKKVAYNARRLADRLDDANYKQFRIDMEHRLRPENIIPSREDKDAITNYKASKDEDCKKVKVRFFHQQANMWNAVRTLYSEFIEDVRYEVLVVFTGKDADLQDLISQGETLRLNYTLSSVYNITDDKPDIAVIYHPVVWPRQSQQLKDIRKHTKLIISLPIMLIMFGDAYNHIHMLNNDLIQPDYCILDKLVYNNIVKHDDKFKQYLLMGNPSYDILYQRKKERTQYPKGWGKLQGKRVLVWATDHGLTRNGIEMDATADLYFNAILTFFEQHKECALIFRPHTTMIKEYLRTFWGVNDYVKLHTYFDNSENLVWDDTNDYSIAYGLANAIVSDINCDMIISALPMGVPVGVLHRYDKITIPHTCEITDNYCNIKNIEDMSRFMHEVLLEKIDKMQQKRQEVFNECVLAFDGMNGKRIKAKIDALVEERLVN